jgi:hypothetical protein
VNEPVRMSPSSDMLYTCEARCFQNKESIVHSASLLPSVYILYTLGNWAALSQFVKGPQFRSHTRSGVAARATVGLVLY